MVRNMGAELGSAQPSNRINKANLAAKESFQNKPIQRNFSRGRQERDNRQIEQSQPISANYLQISTNN